MNNLFRIKLIAILLCLEVLAPSGLFAQVGQGGISSISGSGATTNFRFAEPNELTIVVNLLGSVQRPGRYEISRSIDLTNLLSLAGGPTDGANLDDIKITRMILKSATAERTEIGVNLSNLAKLNEADLVLRQGDVVFVGRNSGVTFQEVLSYLTSAAVVTTAVISIVVLTGPGNSKK
jgi:hypothetical protein